jgi:hypothetical protein
MKLLSLLGDNVDTMKNRRRHYFPKMFLTFVGLHGIIHVCHKTKLFTVRNVSLKPILERSMQMLVCSNQGSYSEELQAQC